MTMLTCALVIVVLAKISRTIFDRACESYLGGHLFALEFEPGFRVDQHRKEHAFLFLLPHLELRLQF